MSATLPRSARTRGFHVMTKPIGPLCNLDCKYCFYLEKERLYPDETGFRMSDEVLESYIRQHEVYRFLREHGSGFMQFIPLVERAGSGNLFSGPPDLDDPAPLAPVTPWSVRPLDYGRFLNTIFDEWIRRDVGKVFVQLFEVHVGVWMGLPASLCVFSETCGRALALEHNGDLYSCDHYVYPEYRLGNIMDQSLRAMVDSETQQRFGADKNDRLPRYCRECDVRFACNGECPKHRFLLTPDGEPGLNYLCAGYKLFFHHVDPYLNRLAAIVDSGRPAEEIMSMVALEDRRKARPDAPSLNAGRNDPCPCGSGKKFKKCCG